MGTPKVRPAPERLVVEAGRLGPLAAGCDLVVRPFTVFVGPQGTGKSLAAQMLYLFRDLERLAAYAEARLAPGKVLASREAGAIIKAILDGLRSGDGYFSPFFDDGTKLKWSPGGNPDKKQPRWESFAVKKAPGKGQKAGRVSVSVLPGKVLDDRLRKGRQVKLREWTRAIYVPTERPLYSETTNPAALKIFDGSSTFVLFAQEMDAAKKTFDSWDGGEPDTEPGKLIQKLARRELGGEAVRRQDLWKWRVSEPTGRRQLLLNIDMASSGQKANWPLVLLAEALFSWREAGRVAEDATLYVEEPEVSLFPSSQCALIQILAMLVHHGFRVVVTTHSLTVLYQINNLIQAGRLPKRKAGEGLPPPQMRLSPEDVSAYFFHRGGDVQDLVNADNGFINEAELGRISASLQDEMNRIGVLLE